MAEEGKKVQSADLPIYGSETAPFIYIDGYRGAASGNGAVRLRLIRTRVVEGELPEGGAVHEVVGHLAMSYSCLIATHIALGQLIESLRAQGELVEAPPAEQQT